MGDKRELKFALEQHWSKNSKAEKLNKTVELVNEQRQQHQEHQEQLDFSQSCDVSLYDHVLDTSFYWVILQQNCIA